MPACCLRVGASPLKTPTRTHTHDTHYNSSDVQDIDEFRKPSPDTTQETEIGELTTAWHRHGIMEDPSRPSGLVRLRPPSIARARPLTAVPLAHYERRAHPADAATPR